MPGRNLATDPLGASIIFRVRRDQAFSIDALSVVETATGTALKLRPHVGPMGGACVHAEFDGTIAYVAADQPLSKMRKICSVDLVRLRGGWSMCQSTGSA